MTLQKLNANPTTEEFKGFLQQSFEYFGANLDDESPDQALVWVFMLASFMVESMSEKEPAERKRIAAMYLDGIHDTFQEAMEGFDPSDDLGTPVNKRAI